MTPNDPIRTQKKFGLKIPKNNECLKTHGILDEGKT